MAFNKPNVNTLWASTGAKVEPTLAKKQQGWISEIPPFEFENWIQNRQDQFNAHVNQYGIAVWDSSTEYQADKSYVQGSDGVVYKAIQTHSNQNPVTDTNNTYWQQAFTTYNFSYSKSESDTLYAKRSNNLSDLSSSASARSNLSVYSKSESDGRFLNSDQNLSEITNAGIARDNLGILSTGENDNRYLNEASNLSDVPNKATARNNIDVYSKGESDGRYLNESSNLSDLTSPATARSNLGLGGAATRSVGTAASSLLQTSDADARYLNEGSNLGDLTNTATARNNLSVYSKGESDSRFLNEASNLSDLPNKATARNNLDVYSTGQVYSTSQSDARYLNESSNLADVPDKGVARSNLDIYSRSTVDALIGETVWYDAPKEIFVGVPPYNATTEYTFNVSDFGVSSAAREVYLHVAVRTQDNQYGRVGVKIPSHSNYKYIIGTYQDIPGEGGGESKEFNTTYGQMQDIWIPLENGRFDLQHFNQGDATMNVFVTAYKT